MKSYFKINLCTIKAGICVDNCVSIVNAIDPRNGKALGSALNNIAKASDQLICFQQWPRKQ